MRKNVQLPLFPEFPTCEECNRMCGVDVYKIVNRRKSKGRRFCSMSCIDAHLEIRWPGWVAVSDYAKGPEPVTMTIRHKIQIESRANLKTYSDRPQSNGTH